MNREGSGRGQTNIVCYNRTNLNLKKNLEIFKFT
jgi:hypothetical protein